MLITGIFLLSGGVIFYHSTTSGLALDTNKLTSSKLANSLVILDKNGETITRPDESFISLSKLSSDTKNAFICAEDKRFYSHSGIDIIRMGKAILSNIKSRSFSEGASTISQQLVKNTQLSSEKTISRKLKEIKLTKELESKYSKEEILEMYLNNIYFGNGCYGIESASKYYFSKPASKLSLSESTALAATINAPSFYDLKDKPENVKKRRDLILDLMQKSSKINEIQCKNAKLEEILTNITNLSSNNFLFDEVINEACFHLKTTPSNLANSNIKIYTNIDPKLINQTKNILEKNYSNLSSSPNIATLVLDNKTKNIISITGNKNTFKTKKQPGSAIKPILVFAPAIENNIITPYTKILDEPINISGFAPQNSGHIFHGEVTTEEALINSYNIPAVKLLNEVGISEAQNFAKKLGIEFSDSDHNLAIALGGFTEGTTLKSLADAYMCFSNLGNFAPSDYISKITQNEKTIYKKSQESTRVMKTSTAYLITNMLTKTSKIGTAKRLKNFGFEVASKTGTVGIPNSSKNKEAYCLAYTSSHTILTYFGGESMPENINGSTYPTMLMKNILEYIYNKSQPENFKVPDDIKFVTTENNKTEENQVYSTDNLPQDISLDYKINVYNFSNKKPIIEFKTNNNYSYEIIRKTTEKEEIIFSSSSDKNVKFEDKTAKNNEIYEYFVKFCTFSNNEVFESNHIKLKTF